MCHTGIISPTPPPTLIWMYVTNSQTPVPTVVFQTHGPTVTPWPMAGASLVDLQLPPLLIQPPLCTGSRRSTMGVWPRGASKCKYSHESGI